MKAEKVRMNLLKESLTTQMIPIELKYQEFFMKI